MAWTGITAVQTDANSPTDQTLWDLVRTNDKDHEDRIAAGTDPGARIFSHFAETGAGLIVGTGIYNMPGFKMHVSGPTWKSGMGLPDGGSPTLLEAASDDHSLILNYFSISGPNYADLFMTAGWHFGNRVKPLTFVNRFKFIAADDIWNRFEIGYVNRNQVAYASSRSRNGIFLEPGSMAGQWRFVSADANVATVGSDIAQIADGTWFEVKIEFTDVGGNQAKCYLNGDLKETLTTNLPTTRVLMGGLWVFKSTGPTDGDKIKTDSMLGSAGGALVNAA